MQVILRSFCVISMIFLTNMAQAETRISVASVNGETIWLDQVMQAAEGLPPEYRNKPMQEYFGDIVADIIDTKLAAKAGEAAKLTDDPLVQDAMKLAGERILAEAWLAVTVREKMTDEALQQAYDTFVARWYRLLKQPLLRFLLAVFRQRRCKPSSDGMSSRLAKRLSSQHRLSTICGISL